eukprot:gene19765-25284_t
MTYISGTWKGFIYEGSWANNHKYGHGVMIRYADSESTIVSYIGDFADENSSCAEYTGEINFERKSPE